MPGNEDRNRPHIYVIRPPVSEKYTSARFGFGSFEVAPRNRRTHGRRLRQQLEEIQAQAEGLANERRAAGIAEDLGFMIQFESEPQYDLKTESLDNRREGIELLRVESGPENKTIATVAVPQAKLEFFRKRIEEYLTRESKRGKPKNEALIANVAAIKLAGIRDLWAGKPAEFPGPNEEIWWELWLRKGFDETKGRDFVQTLVELAAAQHLRVSREHIDFPERTVMLIQGTPNRLSQSLLLLNSVAELRKADSVESFVTMPLVEEADWVQEAIARTIFPPQDAPSVCILDTGVNNGHPMLQGALSQNDMLTYDRNWLTNDHDGHGTGMAGLALYGDLFDVMMSTAEIELVHRLESVKLLPPAGQNDPNLYGYITQECVSRAEVNSPDRRRVICLAVSTRDFRDRGNPTAWSASIDQLCVGALGENDPKRFVVVSGGNAHPFPNRREDYPAVNYSDEIHDPAQAWNALTVGAYTEKNHVDPGRYPGYTPLAPNGALSPFTTTSLVWDRQWPFKPDLVLEGGNLGVDGADQTALIDSLFLLSTYYDIPRGLLSTMSGTSAAAALVARMGAIVSAKYPRFWPETIRALLVHSAEWTDQMCEGEDPHQKTKNELGRLLRLYGYGVPYLDQALWSAANNLTLISQNEIKSFVKEGGSVKTNLLNLHSLPWPSDALIALGETRVEMRVTLSYFIEPNLGDRGEQKKFLYRSHGLQFAVKTATESLDEFRRRINRAARGGVGVYVPTSADSDRWLFGPTLRNRGSIQSDIWRGSAVELASKESIAVYPETGWWKERPHHDKWGSTARYALVVSIRTEAVGVDIYTPVAIAVPI